MEIRLRLTFAKTEAMRFTGNLDVQSTLERTFRRAHLPLVYSEGFTPRPKINLASALPLGHTSNCELADFWLSEPASLDDIRQAFLAAAPPGVRLLDLQEVALNLPKLQTLVQSTEYHVTLLPDDDGTIPPAGELDEKIAGLLAAPSLVRERRDKTYDLRPLVLSIARLSDSPEGEPCLSIVLSALPNATGRAEEVVDALGYDPLSARYHRVGLLLAEPLAKP